MGTVTDPCINNELSNKDYIYYTTINCRALSYLLYVFKTA